MDSVELLEAAHKLLAVHRDALLIDPFIKISLDLTDGNFVSECKKDTAALSWRITLNPNRHNDIIDVQYSIVESILSIMFDDFSLIENSNVAIDEYKRRIVSRLTVAICQMMNFEDNEEEEIAYEG